MSNTVHVKGISSQTSEKEVRDFFSFCGKIQSLSVKSESSGADSTQSAAVTFEKETAAKTALLLDNTQLGPAQVHVSASQSLDQIAGDKAAGASGDEHDLAQEDKPRARVAAEMLAQGYTLSDQVIQRAIALDQQHGISNRFTSTLQQWDQKLKVTERAQQADKSYGISQRADAGWRGLNSYFEKALETPTGQKLRTFYDQGQKQVLDVHNEAKHLQSLKAGKDGKPEQVEGSSDRTQCKCQADAGVCGCAPGKCACSSCSKNPDTTVPVGAEKAELEKVDDQGNTKCNCAGNDSKCACQPGSCKCASCPKAS
ncbi:hypothetical protein DOTSEDRAFT_73614 [Dothistroma septosporum NZE10]|uniref:RRM domain-containing protein n=1 Tax=Dothistroma septosporum (strain NZE10 / CBS 128990) TaxID=675120 RepID=N1PIX3_DOTSN|nr:hypothetical protein DOTSEDRAFT_73614 [Dothistroma septosporum NZE10]